MKYTYDILDANNNLKIQGVYLQGKKAEGLECYYLPKFGIIETPLYIQELGIVITKVEK